MMAVSISLPILAVWPRQILVLDSKPFCFFLFIYFETESLYAALAIVELAMWTIVCKDGFYRLTEKTSEMRVWVRSWCSLGHIGSPKVTRLLITSIPTFLGRKLVIACCFKVNRSP